MDKIIVGGGIGGLSAAYYIIKKFPSDNITLIEGSYRVGGWMRTWKTDEGIIFEQGPRTIRPRGEAGANTLQLLEELKLGNNITPIYSSQAAAKKRMIYANKALHTLPSSVFSLFTTQEPFSQPLIKYILSDLFTPKKFIPQNDESIYDFACRRFGREVGDYLISPMICGICGGNAKEISVKFLMEPLFQNEQKHGSVIAGLIRNMWKTDKRIIPKSNLWNRAMNEKWSVYTFDNGIEMLPRTLFGTCSDLGINFKLMSKCTDISFDDDYVTVTTNDNQIYKCNHLISALPADELGETLKKQHPQLTELLQNISTVSLGVVNLKYPKKVIKDEGFGFLAAPSENLPILGVIYDSCCIPCGTNTVLTVMMGGHWFNKYFGENPSNDLLYQTAVENVNEILDITIQPTDYKVNILHNCIPQYKVGHQDNLKLINDYIKEHRLKLSLCGASYKGVGVNDVILSSKHLMETL